MNKVHKKVFTFPKIIKNLGFLTIGRISGDIFSFIFFVVISRKFGQDGIGQYSFAMAFTGFFIVFVDLGMYYLVVKELSRNFSSNNSKYYGQFIALRLILSLTVFGALALSISFLNFSIEAKLIILVIGLNQILVVLVDGIAAIFAAREDMEYAGLIELGVTTFNSLVAIPVVFLTNNLLISLTVFPAITTLIFIISLWWVIRKYGQTVFSLNWAYIKEMLREALPYGSAEISRQVSSRADVVLIGFLIGASAVGIYNAAYRIVFFFMFAVAFISLALLPAASKLYYSSLDDFYNLLEKSMGFVFLFGFPIAMGTWLIAPDLINLIFGDDFIESGIILQILSFILFITLLKSVMALFLTASDQQHISARCQWVAAMLNITGNSILIPYMGIKGAAFATIFSEFVLLVLFASVFFRYVNKLFIASRFFYGLLGSLLFTVPFTLIEKMPTLVFVKEISKYIQIEQIPLFIIIPSSILIYFIFLVSVKNIRNNELSFIFKK